MSNWGIVGSILLEATTTESRSSGFPVAAGFIFIGLIIAIVIWDIAKARRENSRGIYEDEDERH